MPKFLDLDPEKKNPDWSIVFAGGINAGDAAAVMWESKFEGAYGLWLLKTKQKPRPEQTDAMKHGNVTEPLVFEWYSRHKNLKGRAQVWAVMDDCEWIRGLGDFWCDDIRHGAEFKSPTRDDSEDHELAKEGVVPYHYLLQCWHLMEVYDAATWDYVSWRSDKDAVVLPVKRNTEFWITEMLPAYMEFWNRVQEHGWPKPDGVVFTESEEWRMHAERLLVARAMAREAKQQLRREDAWLKRNASARKTVGGGISALWMEYRPRYEITISVDTPVLQDQVMKALAPLRPRLPLRGREKKDPITKKFWPPNLVLRVSESDDSEPDGRLP